jgi:hypothetical protein
MEKMRRRGAEISRWRPEVRVDGALGGTNVVAVTEECVKEAAERRDRMTRRESDVREAASTEEGANLENQSLATTRAVWSPSSRPLSLSILERERERGGNELDETRIHIVTLLVYGYSLGLGTCWCPLLSCYKDVRGTT